MRRFLLAISIQLSVTSLFAADILPQEAIRIANDFVQHDQTAKANIRKAPAGTKVSPSIAHKMPSRVAADKDNVYIINLGGDQGFVVVSGETGAEAEILGYCDHGSFNYDEAPIQLQDLLAQYCAEVDSLRQNPALASGNPRRARDIGFITVGPLLTTTWSQWAPYNNQCPAGCPSGCVPTAIAQIMNYWKWPRVSQGNLLDRVTGQPTGADFSGHVYDWDNMLDDYSAGYNAEQAAAVAKLMADIGTAWFTSYAPEGSRTHPTTIQMYTNFGYDPDIGQASGNTAADVQTQLKNELNQMRPVFYVGYPADEGDGHALVCDGYTSANYFHFNYGWGGSHDGWFKNALVPIYPNRAFIWTGARPIDGQRVTIGDIEYLLSPNGEAQIIQYIPTGVSNVVMEIPDTVVDSIGNTYMVTRIWHNAFYSRGHFSKITIGGNIKSIHQNSFISSKIDTLVIGDKMEEVPDGAFQTTQIQHLTIGASVRRIGKQAFRLCRIAQVVSRSPGFEVDDEAFFEGGSGSTDGEWYKCITKLGSRVWASIGPREFAVMPQFEQLREIKAEAFMSVVFPNATSFPNPNKFHVYPNLKIIHPGAFEGSNLRYFEVDQDNPYFSMMDSTWSTYMTVLFNKSKTSVVAALPSFSPMGSVYYNLPYPETVVKLEPGSVGPRRTDGTCTRDFIIPKTVVEMEGAFQTCYNLYNLYCLAPVPPVVTDSTFNEKLWNWRVSDQTATLKVPAGTEDLYRNAPGWRQFTKIEGVTHENANTPFDLTPPQHQYDMVVNYNDEEGSRQMSVPVSEVNTIHFDEQENKFILSRTGRPDLTLDVDQVDSLCWKHSFVYDDAEAFELNDSTFTAEGQFCTVTFDPTVIDEDVTLYIRNAVLTPHVLDGQISGRGFDIGLSNGAHELSGTVEIRVPMELGSDEFIAAGYFNEELGEWEPVYCKYDTVSGVATIRSNHLSQYFIFKLFDRLEVAERLLSPLTYQSHKISTWLLMNVEWKYTSPGFYTFDKACNELLRFMLSDDPEAKWAREAKTNLALMQSIGIDIIYSWISGAGEPWGFAPEKLNDIIGKLGYVTIAMNIMDVVDASLHNDDVSVASNTLSAILNSSNMALTSTFATPVLSASMGCVAFIGICLNHLGTTMQAWQKEMFRIAYRYYYSVEGYREIAPASKYHDPQGTTGKKEYPHSYFRTPKDWFDYFYPAFQEGRMTEDRLFAYVEQSVRRYTERFWEDNQDARTWAYEWAQNKGFFTLLFDTEALRNEISNEYYAELMNTTIPTVIESIKKELAVEAYERQRATMKAFSQEMNTKVTFRFIDSSCKKGEVSKYKNWQVQYAEIPETVADPENLVRTISEDGTASFSLTALAIVVHKLKPKMVLLNTNMVEQKTFDFEIPNGTNQVIVTIDIDKGGVEIEVPELKNLRLEYDPASIETFYTWAGTWNGGTVTHDGTRPETYVLLDNSLNKKARFQTEIERFFKQHDFIYEDAYGHIKIGNDIMGNMENGQYKGTFTIDVTHPFTERTVAEYVEDFNKGDFDNIDLLLNLLNGTIRHTIDCQFTVTPDPDGEGYTVSYTGEGIYDFTAEVVDRVDGVDFDNLGNTQHVTVDQITTREVTQIGTVTLQYSLRFE